MNEKIYDVFVSHSSENRHEAEMITHHLESLGVRCFLAQESIIPGEDWRARLGDAITQSRAVVLVFTRFSNESKYVKEEIQAAVEEGLLIVPFRLENVKPNAGLKLPLTGKHWLDAVNPPLEQHVKKLGRDVCLLLHITPARPFEEQTVDATGNDTGENAAGRQDQDAKSRPHIGIGLAKWCTVAACTLIGFALFFSRKGSDVVVSSAQTGTTDAESISTWEKGCIPLVDVQVDLPDDSGVTVRQDLAGRIIKVTRVPESIYDIGTEKRRLINRVWAPVYIRSRAGVLKPPLTYHFFVDGVTAGNPNAGSARLVVDPLQKVAVSMTSEVPGFTHRLLSESPTSLSGDVLPDQVGFSIGPRGRIDEGEHKVAFELLSEGRPVYRGTFRIKVPNAVEGPIQKTLSRREWLAEVSESSVNVYWNEGGHGIRPVTEGHGQGVRIPARSAWLVPNENYERLNGVAFPIVIKASTGTLPSQFQYRFYLPDHLPRLSEDEEHRGIEVDPMDAFLFRDTSIEGFGYVDTEASDSPKTEEEKKSLWRWAWFFLGHAGHLADGQHEIGMEILAGGKPAWRGFVKLAVAPNPAPNLIVYSGDGIVDHGATVDAYAFAEVGNRLYLSAGFAIQNFGGPASGPLVYGWRLPKGNPPLPAQSGSSLRQLPAGDFLFELTAPFSDSSLPTHRLVDPLAKLPVQLDLADPGWEPLRTIEAELFLKHKEADHDLFSYRLKLRPRWMVECTTGRSGNGECLRAKTMQMKSSDGSVLTLDCDLSQYYRLTNNSSSQMPALKQFIYFKGRGAYDSSGEPGSIIATDPLAWPTKDTDWGPSPPGFSLLMRYSVDFPKEGGPSSMKTSEGQLGFCFGRGSYVPTGKHEAKTEVRTESFVYHRGTYLVDVPPPKEPYVEVLDDKGQPLLPGSELAGYVDQHLKNPADEAATGFSRQVTLCVPLQCNTYGTESLASGNHDLVWYAVLPDELKPHPAAGGDATFMSVSGLKHYIGNGNGQLGGTQAAQTQALKLIYPLDLDLPKPAADKAGRWVKTGKHKIRLIALAARNLNSFTADLQEKKLPDRNVVLFERDFLLSVTQSAPLEIQKSP